MVTSTQFGSPAKIDLMLPRMRRYFMNPSRPGVHMHFAKSQLMIEG